MAEEAYIRYTERESRIWPRFLYPLIMTDDQVIESTMIFGLYHNAYLNNMAYLEDIEATALANLLNDYNTKIAGLTNEETVLVLAISSKRYLAGIEKQINDYKVETKRQEVVAESAELEAKIDALTADRAALITLQTRLETEVIKSAARIVELEALIDTEAVNLALVDVEVAEKEIQVEKIKLQIIKVGQEALRVQIRIVEAAIDIIEVDEKVARIRVEIVRLLEDMDKTDIYQKQIEELGFRLSIIQKESDLIQDRITITGYKDALATEENTSLATWKSEQTANKMDEFTLQEERYNLKKQALDLQQKMDELHRARTAASRALDLYATSLHNLEALSKVDNTQQVDDTHTLVAESRALAAIAAEQDLAKANITNALTHVISSGK